MQRIRRSGLLTFVTLLSFAVAGCGGSSTPTAPAPIAALPAPVSSSNPATIGSYPVSFTEFGIPAGQHVSSFITVGPDGRIWFSVNTAIDAINGLGSIRSYSMPALTSYLSLAADGASDIWFVGACTNAGGFRAEGIGHLTTSGAFGLDLPPQCSGSEFDELDFRRMKRAPGSGVIVLLNQLGQFGRLLSFGPNGSLNFNAQLDVNAAGEALTAGPDGNVYVAAFLQLGSKTVIYQVRPNVQSPSSSFILPFLTEISDMTSGPDKNLWLLEPERNVIARVATSGTGYTEFPVPTENAGLQQIVAAPDGALYFTESNANKIGRITTDGKILEFDTPAKNSAPSGITACPDLCENAHVRLFITEGGVNKVARFEY